MGGTVGWIGVGKMGRPMASRIIDAGHELKVCDPVQENRASLIARGAGVVNTPAELDKCEIIFSTVPNDAALLTIIAGTDPKDGLVASLSEKSVFVDMSTVSPGCSRNVAERLAQRGVGYVRAPLSGSTAMAKAGTLTVLASGDPKAWETALPYVETFSSSHFYLGHGEEARYMKLVLNALVGATSAVLSEALVLGGRGGLSKKQMLEVICRSAVASPLIQYKVETIETEDYTPAFSIDQMVKDFSLISDAGRHGGLPLFVTNLILQEFQAASNKGYAEEDFFALIAWMEELSSARN